MRGNAWCGTLARGSRSGKFRGLKPPLFLTGCPSVVDKFLRGELIDYQKIVQQRKSERPPQLSRTLGVYLGTYRKLEIPNQYPADSWDQLALPLLNS